ncbi:MAG: hypothetical protein FWF25_00510 [Propionibacteriaceae bacterium]|nr:hypothetical protein [Propionibacteriaceae bacterium]
MTRNTYKKRHAVIAAVAGASLLMGGSTYALWSASADLGYVNIRSGNFALGVGANEIWDISPDRTYRPDKFSSLNPPLATKIFNQEGSEVADGRLLVDGADPVYGLKAPGWSVVPGDELAILVPVIVTLDGDNLIARLDVDTADASDLDPALSGSLAKYMTVSYGLYDSSTKQLLTQVTPDGNSTSVSIFLTHTTTPMNIGDPTNPQVLETDPRTNTTAYMLCVLMKFNSSTGDGGVMGPNGPLGVQSLLVLKDVVQLHLTQVRTVPPAH